VIVKESRRGVQQNIAGTPNHSPDNTGTVDDHDRLTGADLQGKYDGSAASPCSDGTSLASGVCCRALSPKRTRRGGSFAVYGPAN